MVLGFVVTGFGPFSGVPDNPTEALIELLEKDLQAGFAGEGAGPDHPSYSILRTSVLEVAAQPVREWLAALYSSPQVAAAVAQGPVAVIHLGVDVKGTYFKLEQQAVNDASFRCPDQRGWQPQGVLIDDHPGCSLNTRLLTDLDVASVADQLAEQRRHDVRMSLDAGRFICNLTYYLSLLHTQKVRQRRGTPLHALFLHMPPLSCVPLGEQYRFLRDVLAVLAAALAPPPCAATPEPGRAEGESSAAEAEAEAVAAEELGGKSGAREVAAEKQAAERVAVAAGVPA